MFLTGDVMSTLRLGSVYLDDQAFVAAVESCELPAAQFHHADHVRLAWIYLGQMALEEAERRIERVIRRFAGHNGVPDKYHHTITLAWTRLVAVARHTTEDARDFGEFARRNPRIFEAGTLCHHYSAQLLASNAARAGWADADLCELPPFTAE